MTEIQKRIYDVFIEFDRVCQELNLDYTLSFGTLLGAVRHEGFIPWDDDIDVIMKRDDYEVFLRKAPNYLDKKYFLQTHDTDKYYYFPFAKIRNDEYLMKEEATAHLDMNHGVWIDIFPYDAVPDDQDAQDKQFDQVQKYTNLLNFFLYMYVTGHERKIVQIIKKIIIGFNRKFYKVNFMLNYWYKKREHWIRKYDKIKTKELSLVTFRYKDKNKYYDRFIKRTDFDTYIELKFENGLYPAFENYHEILTNVYGDYMTPPPIEEQKSVHTLVE